MSDVAIVIPTIGRSSLHDLLASLGDADAQIVVVDDRRDGTAPLPVPERVTVVRSGGRGPAAARNAGWRHAQAPWVCFLDDDVVVSDGWFTALQRDLFVDGEVAASQALLEVPLPADRAPTDWERNVAGLATSAWITADMAYRRSWLQRVGGFDERFKRAYREDSDLALRVHRAGGRLVRGSRRSQHPVRPADRWISVRLQRGNADDVLMDALHGKDWREAASAGNGRFAKHAAIVATSAVAAGALAAWIALVGEFAYARIKPGPRTREEIADDAADERDDSVRRRVPSVARSLFASIALERRPAVKRAILFDRDGTLIVDNPPNNDVNAVQMMPTAEGAIALAREWDCSVGVVSNQPAIAHGKLRHERLSRG